MSDSTKLSYIDSNGNLVVIEKTEDGNKLPCVAV